MNYSIRYTMRNRAERNKPIPGVETSEQQLDTNGPIFTGYLEMLRAGHPLPKMKLLSALDEQVKEAYELFYNECVSPNSATVRHVIEVNKIG